MKKNILPLIFLSLTLPAVKAQQSGSGIYKFLEIPVSTHAAALGGNTVSVIDDDLSLVYHNPALLGKEMNNMLSLDYNAYVANITIGTATYCKSTERFGTFAGGFHYMDYGSITGRTATNEETGTLAIKDIAGCLFYSYDFSDRWRGGVGSKFIYSNYADYSSFGIAVDLGLSYYDPDNEYSFGLALKNMGSQIVSYNDVYEKMPWDLQIGFTKQLAHAPFKISVTMQNMREWDFTSSQSMDGQTTRTDNTNFAQKCLNHVLLGVDFTPGKNFYASIGYNYRRRTELAVGDKAGLTGFSAGAGLRIKSYRVGFAVAQYHVSGLSYHFSIARNFGY